MSNLEEKFTKELQQKYKEMTDKINPLLDESSAKLRNVWKLSVYRASIYAINRIQRKD